MQAALYEAAPSARSASTIRLSRSALHGGVGGDRRGARSSATRASSRSRAASIPRAAGSLTMCAWPLGTAPRRRRTSASATSSTTRRRGFDRLMGALLMGQDRLTVAREVGREGVASTLLADDMEALRGPLARKNDVDDDQLNGPIALAFYVRAAEKASRASSPRDDPDGHPHTSREGVDLPAEPLDAPRDGHDRVPPRRCRQRIRSRSPVTTSARPAPERGAGAAFTLMNGFITPRRRSSAASTSTTSRRGSRSSSTPTSTSSRRSPSTGRRGGSGRASCASATAPRARARG